MGEKRSPSPLVAAVVCSCAIPRLSLSLFLFLLCLILVQSTEEGRWGWTRLYSERTETERTRRQKVHEKVRSGQRATVRNGQKQKKQQGGESWRDVVARVRCGRARVEWGFRRCVRVSL
jgi:hypothetical protein